MDRLFAPDPAQSSSKAGKRGRAVTVVLQHLIDAISLGSLYALAALGIGLIFGVLRLVNFAHGDFITVGSYALILPSLNPIAVMMVGDLPAHFLVPAIITTVVVLALLTEIIVFRPLRTADPSTMMIGAFALSYLIQHVILAVYSSRPKAVNLWSELNFPVEVAGLRIPKLEIVTVATTLALMIMFGLFLRYTPHGVQMRAASEDFRMARMLGIRANVVIGLAFGMSGALAAIVSLLLRDPNRRAWLPDGIAAASGRVRLDSDRWYGQLGRRHARRICCRRGERSSSGVAPDRTKTLP